MRLFIRTCLMAVHALRRNVLRSALTTLGIVIGVAAVIAMMEIGQGSSATLQQSIKSMGADNVMILPGTASSGGGCRRSSRVSARPRACAATRR